MSSLPRDFTRNALSNYAAVAVSLLLALVITPIMVRGLGKVQYGVWGLASSAVQYFALLQFGLGGAAVRFVAIGRQRGDTERVRTVIATTAFALIVPGAVVLLISPGLAFLFPRVFHVPELYVVPAMIVVAMTAIEMAVAIPSDTFGATLVGLERFDLLNLTIVATSLAQAIGWLVVIALGGGLVPLGACLLGFSLIGQFARYALARRLLGAQLLAPRYFERTLVRPLLSTSAWIAIADTSDTIIGQIDPIVVGIIAGVPEAAVYIVGQKLASLASSLTQPVQNLFFPHAARLRAAGDEAGLRASVSTGTRIGLAVAIPTFLITSVLAKPALHAWVGPGYESAALVVIFLTGALVANTAVMTLIYVLQGEGEFRTPALFGLLAAGLNLPLSIGLGLAIGFQGVALATLIADVIVCFGLKLPYCCRRLQISSRSLVMVVVRSHMLPVLATGAVGILLVHTTLSGLLAVTAAGAIMAITYGAVMLATGVTSDERALLINLFRTTARRRLGGKGGRPG